MYYFAKKNKIYLQAVTQLAWWPQNKAILIIVIQHNPTM